MKGAGGSREGRHLVTIALQQGRCISKGIHSNLNGALFKSCVQSFGQIEDGLQLEQQSAHLPHRQISKCKSWVRWLCCCCELLSQDKTHTPSVHLRAGHACTSYCKLKEGQVHHGSSGIQCVGSEEYGC